MRISDWSSDVCSSDLLALGWGRGQFGGGGARVPIAQLALTRLGFGRIGGERLFDSLHLVADQAKTARRDDIGPGRQRQFETRLLMLLVALAPEGDAHVSAPPITGLNAPVSSITQSTPSRIAK